MHASVLIAIIANLIALSCPATPPSIPVTVKAPAAAYSAPVSISDPETYLYINGELEDVTADVNYSEDHVFYLGDYVGDVSSDGTTIVDGDQITGYVVSDGSMLPDDIH